MQTRHLVALKDKRLTERGNSLLNRLFAIGGQSIRQLAANDSQAKAFYRFLANENASEDDLIHNMAVNCQACVADRPLLCIQDSSEINLATHRNRLRKDESVGLTDGTDRGLGFFIHPSLVIDAETFMPYGFADVKVWNRGHELLAKAPSYQRGKLPIEQKESYKWGKAVRKLCLLILETVIKLFIMQSAHDSPHDLPASSCFSTDEQACMELQIPQLAFFSNG